MPQDMPDWTSIASIISANGTVLTVGNKPDYLGQFTFSLGTVHAYSVAVTAATVKTDYSEIVVQYTADTPVPAALCVVVSSNLGTSTHRQGREAAFGGAPGTTKNPWQAIVPCPVARNKQITLTLYFAAGGAKGRINVWGNTGVSSVQMRSDGRAYPIGSHHASVSSSTTGTHTLVAAPTSPLRLLVRTLSAQSAATAAADVAGTVGGTFQALVYNLGNMATSREPAGGLLLDAGIGLTLRLTAAHSVHAQVSYDLVV